MARSGQPSYFYRFSYVAEGLRGKVLGALHASEIPYVFDNLAAAPETSMSKVWLDGLYAGGFSPTACKVRPCAPTFSAAASRSAP